MSVRIDFDQVPGEQQPALRLALPRVNQPVEGLILSARLLGCRVHWAPCQPYTDRYGLRRCRRTQPCLLPHQRCECCDLGLASEWKGYLACRGIRSRGLFVVQLTELSFADDSRFDPNSGSVLRGHVLKLTRGGPRSPAQERASLSPGPVADLELPPEPDLLAFLSRLWGFAVQRLEGPAVDPDGVIPFPPDRMSG